MSDQAQPLSGPATVEPALGEVPAGRDEENIVQTGYPAMVTTTGSALITGAQSQSQSVPGTVSLTWQVGRLICLHTSWISALRSSAWSSHRQLEFPVLLMVPVEPGLSRERQAPHWNIIQYTTFTTTTTTTTTTTYPVVIRLK